MKNPRPVGQLLGRAFLFQAALISAVGVLSVFAAAFSVQEVLLKRALEDEAAHFWARRESEPGFALPDTSNMVGYLATGEDVESVPERLAGLTPGFHRLPSQADFSLVYVDERRGKRLYLVFDGERVSELVLLFGLAPLAVLLAVLYLAAWLAYRLSRRAVLSLERLEHEIERLDPADMGEFADAVASLPAPRDQEVAKLAEALVRLARRVKAFVERERNFTRDASHELRSPLTVIRLAATMLLENPDLDAESRSWAERIQRAARDMEELSEALLLLARESDRESAHESFSDAVDVNTTVEAEMQRMRPQAQSKGLALVYRAPYRLRQECSERVLSVLLGNLLGNAVKYTDEGAITVEVGAGYVTVEDSGEGIAQSEVARVVQPFYRGGRRRPGGFGVGLSIVKRLTERFGWRLDIQSEVGVGTRVTVGFPAAEVLANPVCRSGESRDARAHAGADERGISPTSVP